MGRLPVQLSFALQFGDRCTIARRFVGIERGRLFPVLQASQGLAQEPLRCLGAAGRRQVEIDRVAPLVDCPVQVGPLAPHLDVGFIQAPARIKATPPEPAQPLLHLRGVALDPAIDRRMVDRNAAFRQHFLKVAIADRIATIPAHRPQDHITLEMAPLEIRHRSVRPISAKHAQASRFLQQSPGGTAWQQTDEEFEIDDEQSASDENETLMLEGDLTWCRFTKPSRVYKQEVVKERPNLILMNLPKKEAGRDVSTGEPHQGGSLPAADVGGKEDVTDRERQFASRFKSFDRMLQVLKFKHKCRILHEETLPLPKVGRSKQHLLENGTQRAIKAVRLRYMQTDVVLLEVDTSDGIKMLSTKVIFGSDARDWIEHFTLIRKGVVAKSISWPNELLDGLFGENCHIGINHPKHQGAEAGNIPVESIESWAQRFTQCLSH